MAFKSNNYSVNIPRGVSSARLGVETTNKVLRNTYLLLAITMVPTAIGAVIGAVYPLAAVMGMWSLLVFFAVMFGMQGLIIANRHSAKGVGWLLLFTFAMGYFIGPIVGFALNSYSNGGALVATAAGGTAAIFFGLAGYATTTKRDFSSMGFGKSLMIGMWMLFVIAMINLFFANSIIALAVSSLFIVIASGFILFTINRVVRGGEDNYIMATMVIYIMLLNLFQSLLHLLMIFAGNRE